MSLSPNVTPFVPSHQSVVPSQQTNAFRDSKWKLSADVAEFVPGRLKNGSTLPKNPTSIISATTVTQNTEPLIVVPPSKMGTDGQSVPKNISNVNSSKPTPKTYSFKTDGTANLSKKKFSLLKPDHHKTMKEDIPTKSNYDKNNIESDFPALGTSTEKIKTPRTVWSQPFGMSFSEKLKSKNTSSYFYEDPPRLGDNKPLKEEQRLATSSTGNENKAMQKHIKGDGLNSIKLGSVLNKNTEPKNIAQPQSDNEGFSIVKKSNKSHETMSMTKDDKTTGRRRIALHENLSDDNTKERTKGVVRFSESRSKTSDRQRPTRERLSGDMQKHSRSSNSANWTSGKNITEKEKEPRGNDTLHDGGSSRTRQSFEPTKDYFALKSTHGVLENKNVNLKQKDDRNREKDAGNVHKNISPNIATVETKAPLSYSDILKSKPSQVQLPDSEKVDGKEKGVLRIPSEASEDDEMDGEKMEEQEGKTKKKKKKKKKKSTTDVTPQPVKKSKEMLTLDFGDMLTKMMESSATKKKPVIRTGGFLPAQAPLPPKETRTTKKPDITYTKQGANVLDSTAPIVFRSKEREFPKKRKPSAMRKILMKEREEKQMIREGRSKPEESLGAENSENESSERRHSDSDEIDPAEVKKAIHSRKFREYCDQDLDYEINGVVIQLLKELIRFQDRQFHKDPIKAKAKRRFVCGLREVYKHAKLKKLKCVIVTPNLEPTKSKGGLDDLLSNIIDVCHSQNVPVIFSLNRQVLGRVLLKKVPVSIVGIFYYDGAQDYFKSLMILTEVARETYRDKFNSAREKFLLEKRTAKDEQQVEENLESTKVGEDKDETVDNNDDKNVQIKLAINEQVVGDEEKKIASDFAVIEENIESSEVEQDEDETIEYNENILAIKEQIFRDEKKQIASDLAVIEENIEWSEIQQDEDQTIENEDTNVQIQFAIYKQAVEDEEKPVESDLAFVGEDIESSEIQDKHETIENNEDTNVQTKPVINEQEVGDEKKQIASDLATELLERDKNKTIENNEDILAINIKIFGDNEKQITSDLAVVREDIESTEMGQDKDETIENNDNIPSKNEQLFEDEEKQIPSDLAVIQTGLETILTNKDSFPDEEQQMTKDVEIGVQLSEIEENEHQTRTENDDDGETKVESTG